jgi:hypothetical protein
MNKWLALALLSVSPMAFAEFGFGTCCSGYVCGIIPCDNECAGMAFTSWGSDMSSKLADTSSAFGDLSTSTLDVASSYSEFYSNLTTITNNYYQEVLAGLDAFADKVEFAETVKQKGGFETLVDSVDSELNQAYSNALLSRELFLHENRFGDYSYSESLATNLNNVSDLASWAVQTDQWYSDLITSIYASLDLNDDADSDNLSEKYKESLLDNYVGIVSRVTDNDIDDSEHYNIAASIYVTNSKNPILKGIGLSKIISDATLQSSEQSNSDTNKENAINPLVSQSLLNSISYNTSYGLRRELDVVEAKKSALLQEYLRYKNVSNISSIGVE